jgi:hypothetical protein
MNYLPRIHQANLTGLTDRDELLALLELLDDRFHLTELVALLAESPKYIQLAERLVTRRYNPERYTDPEKDIHIQVLMLTAVELTDGKEPDPLTLEEEEAHYHRMDQLEKRLHAAYQLLWAKVTQAPVNR